MRPTLHADPTPKEHALPKHGLRPKPSSDRSRERHVRLERERLIASWLRSLTTR